MTRIQSTCPSMLACGVVLTGALTASSASLLAQTAVRAEPIPGLVDARDAQITQVTRDGGRVAATLTTPDGHNRIVLDTHTGATVFADPVRRYTLSPEGAFVALFHGSPSGDVYLRDLASGEERLAFRSGPGTYATVVSDKGATAATASFFTLTAVWLSTVSAGAADQTMTAVDSRGCPSRSGMSGTCIGGSLGISADGRYVAYGVNVETYGRETTLTTAMTADLTTGLTQAIPVQHADLEASVSGHFDLSGDGHWIGVTAHTRLGRRPRAALLVRATGHTILVAPSLGDTSFMGVSDSGRFVLVASPATSSDAERLRVVDRTSGVLTEVIYQPATGQADYRLESAHLSGDGRTVVGTLVRATSTDQPNRRTFIARLDRDGDGLHDAWESMFGLNPTDPADAAVDPDGDGIPSAQEYAAGSHPRGTPIRYFAEGANGTFFSTLLALLNSSPTDATANVRFLGPDGAMALMPVAVPAMGAVFLEADEANLTFTEFSIIVEGPAPLIAERRMTWDRSRPYGSHSGTGVAAPGTTWHFAEGATIAGFQTFFLLENPDSTAATVTMKYLLANGETEQRVHHVGPHARRTVWVNQEGGALTAAEFGTTVMSDRPVVAERAMYRDAPGEMFAAGSVASGVAAPATSWFFAEGATGAFFDTFVLLANPSDTEAAVALEFLRAHDPADSATALPIQKRYTVPAHSRHTIWVRQEDAALANSQVGVRLQASVPIVAERTMWWPGPTAATWHESHAEMGAATPGQRWAVADIQVDAQADGWDTFLLVATTQQALATVRVELSCEGGTRAHRDIALAANRTTLWMRHEFPEALGHRCAALIESLPTPVTSSPSVPLVRTPIVVEKAMYFGTNFRAGGASLAVRLPDPRE